MSIKSSSKEQPLYAWPLEVNLIILLLMVIASWSNVSGMAFVVGLLALPNGLLGFIFLLFERRRDIGYAGGFFLSFLLLLLLSAGMSFMYSVKQDGMTSTETPASNS